MKKVAIIGLGDIAPIHLEAIRTVKGVGLGAVCDIDPEKQKQYPDISFYTDYQELFDKEKPDCVHLCLPHDLHYPVARAAAEKGIHIFCEKPAAADLKQAADFVRLEAEHPGLQMGICLQNRKNRTVVRLREIITGGSYGEMTGIRGFVPWMRTKEYYAVKPWRGRLLQAGSGVMLNQSIHTLDLMYYLGGEITRLKALSGQMLEYEIEVEDTVAARFTYQNGASGLFFATNANHKNESVSIQVTLTDGEFLIQNNILSRILPDGSLIRLEEDQKLPGTRFYYGAGHKTAIQEYYRAMEHGTDDYIHVRDAWSGMVISNAIFRSSQMNRTVSVLL